MRKILALIVLLGMLAMTASAADAAKIKLGVSDGPHTEIAEVVKKIAAGKGLEIEIITFMDFVMPNAALADGELDVNSMQHVPYLQNMINNRGYKLTHIGNTVLMPMTAFSKRIKSVDELKDGITIAIPNDPSNGGRALLMLAGEGLIEVDPAAGVIPSVLDVTKNDRGFKFVELDAAQLVNVLADVDIAVINTNYAIASGLDTTDALFVESKDSPKDNPYVNVIVVREGEENRPEFKILVESYQNDEVRRFVDERFQGGILAGW